MVSVYIPPAIRVHRTLRMRYRSTVLLSSGRSHDGRSKCSVRRANTFPVSAYRQQREKIGAERFRFPERNPLAPGDECRIHLFDRPVGDRLPGRRNLQRQGEKRFHVRLVETREERTRPVRDQQRIEEFVPAVKRLIVCRKFDSHAVLSVCRLSCIDHDMLVLNRIRDFPAIQQN